MGVVWSKTIDNILRIGQPLDEVGVTNWALSKTQALKVLEQFLASQISVLGGDVYENINGTIQSNYDSWYCDPLPEESKSEFVKRSIEKSRTYIEEYKIKNSTDTLFVFVPNV